ncbi:hypothetical protein CPB85DRAFT_1258034 [Mucidula mucida]|nr:hypothetical protein CPB85DRAFT_1258034 [Mucidula mucida]
MHWELRTCSAGVMFAIQNITEHGKWKDKLKILKEEDIRGINEQLLTAKEDEAAKHVHKMGLIYNTSMEAGPSLMEAVVLAGEGRQTSLLDLDQLFSLIIFETLKIKWCKARTQKLCFEEEVELLLKEMCRVIGYGG